MNNGTSLFLVDGDVRRRAAISHCLAGSTVHVEPFEDPSELIARWPKNGLLLVHDDGRSIGMLLAQMGRLGQWLPVIGFAQEPSTRQVVGAVLEGAIDYVSWPFTREEIIGVVEQAEAKAEVFGSAKLREALARSRVDRLTKRERSMITIALLAALGHDEEVAMHVRATKNTGATAADVAEALLHVAVYAGVP
ncbi:carboxymuconolactone decarboxylase family protein, partial [Novosphingobium sp. SCN 63-17]|uniref:carboxymuconolactone decarboxylase family protein n=1 Tax=Novosphingobium sp. SCN 63-17 TaxID=1660120 RepID=UPI000AA13900